MRKLLIACVLAATANLYLLAGAPGLAYLDIANVFTANQRINAGLGVNVAPGVTGSVSLSDKLFERGRTTALGDWTTLANTDFTFSASAGTWTVDAGDVVAAKWTQVGNMVVFVYNFQHTTTSAGMGTDLLVGLPGTMPTAASQTIAINTSVNSVGREAGFQFINAAGATVTFKRIPVTNWPTETNNLDIQGTLIYPR